MYICKNFLLNNKIELNTKISFPCGAKFWGVGVKLSTVILRPVVGFEWYYYFGKNVCVPGLTNHNATRVQCEVKIQLHTYLTSLGNESQYQGKPLYLWRKSLRYPLNGRWAPEQVRMTWKRDKSPSVVATLTNKSWPSGDCAIQQPTGSGARYVKHILWSSGWGWNGWTKQYTRMRWGVHTEF